MSAKLNPANIPVNLHPLIPLAEQFGIEYDAERRATMAAMTPELPEQLRDIVIQKETSIDDWLADRSKPTVPASASFHSFTRPSCFGGSENHVNTVRILFARHPVRDSRPQSRG